MLLVAIISFVSGLIFAGLCSYVFFSNKIVNIKEELIKLRAKSETSESLQEIIKRDFVQIANETIKTEQEDLRKQNRETLEEKILPLTRELGEFKDKVEKFNLSGVENTTKIIEQIGNLEKNNKIIEKEARNLVEALTKNQNVKGAYGENLLDTILQSCGMQEGVHYTKQFVSKSTNLKDDEIHIVRPDVVLNLPNNKSLIIDSKVTLTSYLDYIEDNSKINEFKNEVKKRIVDLSNKNYQNAEDLLQPDFVLMYMPIESSVNLLYEDSELINQAYKSNIIIVGTASLLTTVRLVNQLMAQQKQAESVQQIVDAGTNLFETFVQFCEDLIDVQKRMQDVASKLTTTINRFQRGNKNKPSLFSQVNALKEYGINTNKEIPSSLLEEFNDADASLIKNDKIEVLTNG
ncbi:MAG: DNA recombination protein RmuC [Cyanobacteria bacterium SIG28]|nr:DNA recombination protein RmuC [Cyanobacteria bacterium SIG28]